MQSMQSVSVSIATTPSARASAIQRSSAASSVTVSYFERSTAIFSGSAAFLGSIAAMTSLIPPPLLLRPVGARAPAPPPLISRLSRVLKPWSSRNACSGSVGMPFSAKSSSGSGSGESHTSRTNSRLIRASSANSIKFCLSLGLAIWSVEASTVSRSPNCWISCDAVLGPMPGTPGTLSTLSPISASTSPTFSGGTPNFSSTSFRPIRRSFMVSSMSIPASSSISCIRSLSELTIVTFHPALIAAVT